MKTYRESFDIGRAKYVVSYHNGTSTHADGSPFFDVAIFHAKRTKDAFVQSLVARGYQAAS